MQLKNQRKGISANVEIDINLDTNTSHIDFKELMVDNHKTLQTSQRVPSSDHQRDHVSQNSLTPQNQLNSFVETVKSMISSEQERAKPKSQEEIDKDESNLLTFPDVQIILLVTAFMYFSLGGSGVFVMYGGDGDEQPLSYYFMEIQLLHIIVAFRYGFLVIFITGLVKWFKRQHLPFLIVIFIRNLLSDRLDEVQIVSGLILIIIGILFHLLYFFDPIDAGYIINEQAIYLTSKYCEEVRDEISVQDFFESQNNKSIKNEQRLTQLLTNQGTKDSSNRRQQMKKILNRWKSPCFLKVFEIKGQTIYFGVFGAILVLELFAVLQRTLKEEPTELTRSLFIIQSQLIFTMYYAICILGPIDIAKSEMLKKNIKMSGILLCYTMGFQFTIASVIFDNLIFLYVEDYKEGQSYFILKGIEIFSTFIAMICLLRMIKEEIREICQINKFNNIAEKAEGNIYRLSEIEEDNRNGSINNMNLYRGQNKEILSDDEDNLSRNSEIQF
ncbi:UNKNOWN [Stylonychia lemnae]|uniref:Transmembrane protein n=1 Tax=Stylonychia lemnae TaxID=5949 RepID=A0A078B598_STYLE|nr:UNKNOWN [Stylonychia lemnae]|eukprot:CDW88452.1 UNKNOWN [Stylonychia lemnae]